MIPFLRISDTPNTDIVSVDCPTCPVNMSCFSGKSGTGWRFDCCGMATMDLGDNTVLVDCQINEFIDKHWANEFTFCPLCSGAIMEVELAKTKNALGTNYYLPTVHAKFPLAERLMRLRRCHKEASALARSIKNEEN